MGPVRQNLIQRTVRTGQLSMLMTIALMMSEVEQLITYDYGACGELVLVQNTVVHV